jgi:phage FluMu protein Com
MDNKLKIRQMWVDGVAYYMHRCRWCNKLAAKVRTKRKWVKYVPFLKIKPPIHVCSHHAEITFGWENPEIYKKIAFNIPIDLGEKFGVPYHE